MKWPAKRVEGIYKAIVIREAVESIERTRRDMIASCYSNPNWDGPDNASKREEYLKNINDHYNKAITSIHYPDRTREADVDWDNPFFAGHKREIERTKMLFSDALKKDGKTAGDLLEDEQSADSSEFTGAGKATVVGITTRK